MIPGLVSVIIPTHDRPHYLPQAVESVLAQTYPSIELIVVDDGSADAGATTQAVLKPYLSSKKVTYLYQDNQGVGHAVNRGLSIAQGQYIQRIDDDDTLLPEKIEKSVDIFESKPDTGLVATGYYRIDSEGKQTGVGHPNPCPGPARLLNILMRCVSLQPAVMVRANVHQKAGKYRNMRGQDYDMWIQIAKHYEIETIDEPLAEVRSHSGNITSNRQNVEQDIIGFISEHLQETPLDVLVPNLQSEPHAYALRAAVYLLKDGQHFRTTNLAKTELEIASQMLPEDSILSLWRGVLAVHGNESLQPHPWEDALSPAYQSKAEELFQLTCERKRLSTTGIGPMMPEAVAFRQRFSRLRSALTQETYKKAVGKEA
jgi:hypothetical protein